MFVRLMFANLRLIKVPFFIAGTLKFPSYFFMNRFRRLGFIELNAEIQVYNSLLNIFLQE